MDIPQHSGDPILSQYASDPAMREVIDHFVSALPDRIDALNAALHDNRLHDLRRLAHQMKGAAGGYGFPNVGAAAAALETTLRDSDSPALDRVASELGALVALCARASLVP